MINHNRTTPMVTVAFILSILAICTSCCIYSAIPLGALSMIFALLSKGGEQTMSSTARFAFIASFVTMIITIILTVFAFVLAIHEYGSLDALMDAYKTLPVL